MDNNIRAQLKLRLRRTEERLSMVAATLPKSEIPRLGSKAERKSMAGMARIGATIGGEETLTSPTL